MLGGLPQVGAAAVLAGVAKFAADSRSVISNLNAINVASQHLGDVSVSSFSRASTATGLSTGAIIRSTGLITVALAGAAAAFKEFSAAASIETTFKSIQALSNSTQEEINALGGTVTKLSNQFGVTMGNIASTAQVLSRAGLSLQEIKGGALEATEAFLKASKGELSVEEAAIAVAQGLTTFRLAASEATRVTNALVNAANGSTASFGDLAVSIKYLGTAAVVLGAPIEDTAAAIAVMAQNSIRGSTAGTGLRAMLQALEKPTRDALEQMKLYNISLFDAQGRFVGLKTLISQLNTAFGEQAVAQGRVTEMERANALARIFTTRGAQAAIALALGGTQAFEQALKDETSAAGIAAKVMESLENQAARVGTTLQNLATNAILPLLPAVANVAKNFADLVATFSPQAINMFNSGLAGIGSALAVISPLAQQIGGAIGVLAKQIIIFAEQTNAAGTGIGSNFVHALTIASNAITTAIVVFAQLISIINQFPAVAAALAMAISIIPFAVVAAGVIGLTAVLTPMVLAVAKAAIVIIAIGAAIQAGIAIYENWDSILQSVSDTIDYVSNVINGVFTDAMNIAQQAITVLSYYLEQFANIQMVRILINVAQASAAFIQWAAIVSGVVVLAVVALATVLSTVFASTMITITKAVLDFADIVLDAFREVGTHINFFTGDVVEGAKQELLVIILDMAEAVSIFAKNIQTSIAQAAMSWANSWGGMGGIAARVLEFVGTVISNFIDFLKQQPILGDFITGAVGAFEAGSLAVGDFVKNAQDSLAGLVGTVQGVAHDAGEAFNQIASTAKDNFNELNKSVSSGLDGVRAKVAAAFAEVRRLENERSLLEQRHGEQGPGSPVRGRGDSGELGFPAASGSGGGGGKKDLDTALELSKRIQALLSDIPGMTRALADFLGGIAKDYPERLEGMVGAIRTAKIEIAQSVIAKRDLLATTIQIEAIDKRIADIQLASHALEIQASLAVIGYQKQLLALKFAAMQVDAQMWPIQDKIRDIDRRIRDLQQENLDIAKQQNDLAISMLPLQNAIADIEKRINEARVENLALQKQIAQLEAAQLPLKLQLLLLDQQSVVWQREYATNQGRIADINLQMLPAKVAIAEIDRKITDTQRINLVLARQQIEAQLGISKQRLALLDIEEKIANVGDRKADLTRKQNTLGLENQLDDVQTRLDKANQGRDVKAILALELEKEAIEAKLDAAEKEQRTIDRTNEISKIGLEIQKQAILDIVKPLQAKLDKLNAIGEIERLQADLVRNALEQQKRLLEESIKPLQARLDIILQTNDVFKTNAEFWLATLNIQKQAITDQLLPLQQRIDLLKATLEQQQVASNIIKLGLEAEKAAIVAQLQPLQDKFDALEREKKAEELRNKAVLLQLDNERRALIRQLEPLEDVRQAIQRNQQQIELQMAAATIAYEEQILELKKLELEEQLRRAELEATRRKQQEVFNELVLKFLEVLAGSEAFTQGESEEVAKRLGLWDDQIEKIAKNASEMRGLEGSAKDAAAALNAIPKNIDVNITYRYITIGSPPSGAGGAGTGKGSPGADAGAPPGGSAGTPEGPVDPGPEPDFGGPPGTGPGFGGTGGDQVVESIRSFAMSTATPRATVVVNNVHTQNYSVDANYARVQSPSSVAADLRSMIQLTQ